MERKMHKIKRQMPDEAAKAAFEQGHHGTLSVNGDDGYPYGAPINHWYNEEDGKLYFHGGKKGHKIDALNHCNKVSFVCTDGGRQSEKGWWLMFRSVVVFGKVEFVDDPVFAEEIVRKLTKKFIGDDDYFEEELKEAGDRTLVFALTPEHITGKTVNER